MMDDRMTDLETRLEIIQSMTSIYFCSIYADIQNDSYIILDSDETTARAIASCKGARSAVAAACAVLVAPEYREKMHLFFDMSTLNERLRDRQIITEQFLGMNKGWVLTYLIVGDRDENGNVKHVFYAAREINDEQQKEDEYVRQLEDATNVITSAGFGMWHIFIGEDAGAARMQVNDKMAQLLDIDPHGMTEEEIYDAWYSRITPEALESIQYGFNEMLEGRFSENTYLWNHPRKGSIYVRSGGSGQKLADGTVMLSGYHADVTAIVLREQKYKAEQDKSRRVIEALSESYRNVYIINAQRNMVEIIKLDGYVTSGMSRESSGPYAYDAVCASYISSRVYEGDREMVTESMKLDHIIEEISGGMDYEFTYRVPENGDMHYYQGRYIKLEGEYIVAGFRNIDAIFAAEEEKNRALQKLNDELGERLNIINSVSKSFNSIYYIDMRDFSFIELGSNLEGVHEIIGGQGEAHHGFETMYRYLIAPEMVEEMREFTDLSTIGERLRGRDWISKQFLGIKGAWSEGMFIAANRDARGNPEHIVWATRSIDETKKKEIAYAKALEEATASAEAANRAKTAFLFNMSHDIRTPMNAILGYAKLIEKNIDDADKCRDYLNKLQTSGDFLLSLINNVLEMARIDSGKTQLDEAPCRPESVLDEVQSVYSEQMRDKNIEYTSTADIRTPYILADQVKLNEILLNLVSNAYKYTPEGGKVSAVLTELACDRAGWTVMQTVVSDTGIGMSADYLAKLFEEFSRESNATEARINGTGLGMSIVKKLVELMDGTITVESEPGTGTTFVVTIPFRIADAPETDSMTEAGLDMGPLKGKRILLAEDNDMNAEIVTEILKESGMKVERAADGIICVDMIRREKEGYYDLILMDIQMPNMDGYKATQKIRGLNEKKKAGIPIIAMTANAFEEDRVNAVRAGMNGHLAKPIEISVLMETLMSFIS